MGKGDYHTFRLGYRQAQQPAADEAAASYRLFERCAKENCVRHLLGRA